MGRFSSNRRRQESTPAAPVATPDNTTKVGGKFQCQLCDLVVKEAIYFPAIKELAWKCPEGHISVLKEFVI